MHEKLYIVVVSNGSGGSVDGVVSDGACRWFLFECLFIRSSCFHDIYMAAIRVSMFVAVNPNTIAEFYLCMDGIVVDLRS